jgi:hypothetical protein
LFSTMHATRYDSDAPPDAEPLDTALAADNDNDTLLDAGESPIVPRGLLPRSIARRDWITAALFIASNGLTAWAWTHPRHAPQAAPPPPVTRVEVAAPPPVAPPAPAPLVVPDLPPAPTPPADAHTREHRSSRASAPSALEPAEPSPQASPRAAAAPEPEAEPTVEPTAEPTGAASSSDGLDEALERASSEHGGEVEACIDAADDEAQGSLTVRIVIAPDGAVRSATPHGPASLQSVGRCLAGAIRRWRVEVPGARTDLTATLPFQIESNEE